MDPPPVAPAPPRSLAAARQLAAAAWALIVVSIVAGVLRGPDAFAILLVLGGCFGVLAAAARGAARKGRPGVRGRAAPLLAPARDLSEYYVAHAWQIFHRHYVRPRTDLDQEARGTWERAVDAANRIYRSESLRDEAVDAERVAADVPELLWRIIEGLAMISDVRINIKSIVKGYERQHPAVYAKIQAQERHLARGTSQVESRISKLEMLARVLGDADAARRGEDMLKRLNEVDEKIDDLVASTDESAVGRHGRGPGDRRRGQHRDDQPGDQGPVRAGRGPGAGRGLPAGRERSLTRLWIADRLQAQAAGEIGRQRAGRVDLGAQLAELRQARVHLLEHRGRDAGILGQVDPAAVAHDELVELVEQRAKAGGAGREVKRERPAGGGERQQPGSPSPNLLSTVTNDGAGCALTISNERRTAGSAPNGSTYWYWRKPPGP